MFKILLFFQIYIYLILAFILKLFFRKKVKPQNDILYFPQFFPENAGYHWRVHKWAELLKKDGYSVDIKQAMDKEIYYKNLGVNQSLLLIKYLNKRFWQVISSRNYSKVIVRRELLPYNEYGNLFLDKLLLKIHPEAILDFDDDIAYSKNEPRKIESLYGKLLLENGSKFTESLTIYRKFIAGSQYLKKYVLSRNQKIKESQIVVIPTCLDYESFSPKDYKPDKETISFGWVGGNHNLFLLDTVISPLNKISEKYNIQLIVIAGKDYKNDLALFPIKNIQWSLETEINDIKQIDVGLMPLLNTKRDKGKAGFKLIQYMGMGVVSIASAVTVNTEIIDDGIDGFLVYEDKWVETFEKVLEKRKEFNSIGKLARKKIEEKYSFNANFELYLDFLIDR